MKRTILLAIAAFMGCYSYSQTTHVNHSFVCSYYGEPINTPITAFTSSGNAKAVIKSIIDVIGLEPTFEIHSSNIPNAAAVISSGKRFILYNPTFISAINQAANDKWASIAILAHEIGHHLNGHTLSGTGSQPAIELEADQFSGFILRKMGASLHQAQLSMKLVAHERASRTHPAKEARLVSIENGWNKANAQITGGQYIAKAVPFTGSNAPSMMQRIPSPQKVQPVSSKTYVLHPKYILFDVTMEADRSNPYYITTSNNFVTIHKAEIIVLGKLKATGINKFPYAIEINGRNEFYISQSGHIINQRSQQIGYLKTNEKV